MKRFLGSSNLFRFSKSNISHQVTFLRLSSSQASDERVVMKYINGLPTIDLKLPSRNEMCHFTLLPVTSSVRDFIKDLKMEDGGIDRVAIYNKDGNRVSSSTKIGNLILSDFNITINDVTYDVTSPSIPSDDHITDDVAMNDVSATRAIVSNLYIKLNIEEFQRDQQKRLEERLEHLKTLLAPLQKVRDQCEQSAVTRTKVSMIGGMVAMAAQYGVLARLTWWEYSWDIMEPVTYFVTAGYAMVFYAYFLLTQQEYIYPAARDRVYLRFFYKAARKRDFDITRYNAMVKEVDEIEADLKRLRDPLQLQLPTPPRDHDVIPTSWKKGELGDC